ncbi:hypothetical protein [Tenacibaculum sp. nBUS_03]|uniref:hypothetical protein n=1 Tax=Tenacibaculum sp. nBUS_03 TaxID=3395320 RepID=UPI003EC0EF62
MNVLIGFRRKEAEQEKDVWMRSRLKMYCSLLPYSEDKEFTPQDVFLFPWEEEEIKSKKKRKVMSLEEMDKKF